MTLRLTEPYALELHLRPVGASGTAYDVTLIDENLSDSAGQTVDLDLAGPPFQGSPFSAEGVRRVFLDGHAVTLSEALSLGRLLADRLLQGSVGALWKESQSRRSAQDRPLRLQVKLPRGRLAAAAEVPFELLADEDGFLFRRPGNVLVRSVLRIPTAPLDFAAGARLGTAWANPCLAPDQDVLPAEFFAQHEKLCSKIAAALRLETLAVCRQATRRGLGAYLAAAKPMALLSLVAHGDPAGGGLLVHDPTDPTFPDDRGEILSAQDFASLVQGAEAQVVLLWSCHGARAHAALGSVAEALLSSELGRVATVVAAHTTVQVATVPVFLEALLQELEGRAAGNLELAVSLARGALADRDLQWAAPAYYSRTAAPVVFEQPLPRRARQDSAAVESTTPSLAARQLEEAPMRSADFHGRDEQVAAGADLLARQRLVTILGAPGIGKTELSLAIAERAIADGALRFARATWTPLQGLTASGVLLARLGAFFGLERVETADPLTKAIGGADVLFVLDNAEDLILADGAGFRDLLDALLRKCRAVRFLLTSRRELGPVAGHPNTPLLLDRLEPPHDRALFEAAAGVLLKPVEKGSADAGRLVQLLDGHPLSIVL
ncbi:MAG TPA: hypothetical protein VGE98_08300, partial [Thermoanaerobaculia bacterium]